MLTSSWRCANIRGLDPEELRIEELIRRVREGVATEAETTELTLYAEEHPRVGALVKRAGEERTLGGHWLVRAEADKRVVAAEHNSLTIAERRVGVGLLIAGAVGVVFFPFAGLALLAGAGLLTWSVLRVKLKTADKDPYKDIQQ